MPDNTPDNDIEIVVTNLDAATRARHPLARLGAFWSAQSLVGRRLTLRQRAQRAVSAGGLVLLALLVVLISVYGLPIHQSATSHRASSSSLGGVAPYVALHLRRDGFNCVTDSAWSPQGTAIAVLGYSGPCNSMLAVPDQVATYDAATAKRLSRWQPRDSILATLAARYPDEVSLTGAMAPSPNVPRIIYDHVLWSPDGQRLALIFNIILSPPYQNVLLSGLLVADATGGHTHIYIQRTPSISPLPTWDLQTGAMLPPATDGTLALTYHWNAHGTISPDLPSAGVAVPPLSTTSLIGNPDGAPAFSIWQPGYIGASSIFDPVRGARVISSYELTTTFAAWSPDARYVSGELGFEAQLLSPDTPIGKSGADLLTQLSQFQMPLRDAGLVSFMKRMSPDTLAPYMIAWRLDGRILAAYGAPDSDFPHIDLYDCATGQVVSTLLPLPESQRADLAAPLGSLTLLRWSPDNAHLMLYNVATGDLLLWGPHQLPR